jgi:hypothetical protein
LGTTNPLNFLPMASQFSRFHSARISVSLVMEDPNEIVYVPAVVYQESIQDWSVLGLVVLGKRILGLVSSGIGRF